MNVQIEESWKQILAPEFEKDYFIRLTDFVRQDRLSAGQADIQRVQPLPLR